MKHILLLGFVLTTVSTVHGMQAPSKTQKNIQKNQTQKNTQKNQIQRNKDIHNLCKDGRHREAEKKLPSNMASLIQYSQTSNDPQFKLWVESKNKINLLNS